jgi:hypothetical protein
VGLLKVSAHFPFTTGLPEDVAINTFWFHTVDEESTVQEKTTAGAAVQQFFTTTTSTGDGVLKYMSEVIDPGTDVAYVRLVDVDPATGEEINPAGYGGFTLNAPTVASMPQEVAVCVSFQQSGVAIGAARARRRGRVFIGPLNINALEEDTNKAGRPHEDFIATLVAAGARMIESCQDGLLDGDPCPWSVYSRAASQMYEITDGWVDNEFDTQRRRGLTPTARTTF